MESATVTVSVTQRQAMPSVRTAQTVAYFASFIALGLTTGALGPTLPALAAQTNVSLGAISYLFTARSLGYLLGSTRGGRIFDSKPGNMVMGGLLLAMAVASTLVPLATRLWLLLIVMLLLGAAEAGLDVGANTLLVRVHGIKVAPFMSAMHSFFGVGALLAPLIVAQVTLGSYPAARSYFVLTLLLLPIAAYTFRLPSPPPVAGERKGPGPGVNSRLVLLMAVFLLLYVGAEVSFAGWIFTYAVERGIGTAAAAAYLTSLFWGSLTLGRMLMIPLAARVKPETILLVSVMGSILSLSAMLPGTRSLFTVSAATLMLGLSMASIFPATLSFAGRRMDVSGRVTGWFLVGSSLGATLLPLLSGQLLRISGPAAIVFVPALAMLFCAAALLAIMQSAKKKVA